MFFLASKKYDKFNIESLKHAYFESDNVKEHFSDNRFLKWKAIKQRKVWVRRRKIILFTLFYTKRNKSY